MDSDQSSETEPTVLAIVHLVVADMPNKAAYGGTAPNGERVMYIDRAAAKGDRQARDNAQEVLAELVASVLEVPVAEFVHAT